MNNAKITTIKLDAATKNRLDKLKVHKKESYDEIIQKILYILNICKANPMNAKKILDELDIARKLLSMKDSKK